MIPLTDYLQDRISQLKNRKMMIPRYVKQPGKFVGKKDFSLADLPKIEQDIRECEVALIAIANLKKR